MFSDPAAAAWVAAGQPAVDAPATAAGRCGRCGQTGPTVASSRVISEKFTAFDTWPFGTRRLCMTCAWAYSHIPTAQPALLITTTTVTRYFHSAELSPILIAGALPDTDAVIVPTTRRRHLLPTAQWGHLATDGLVMWWDEAAAIRLTNLAWLRDVGAKWPQLAHAVPPARLITSQPTDQWSQIMQAWDSLQPWRCVPPMWAAARILTNPVPPQATDK